MSVTFPLDIITSILAFLFTLLILSYMLGDNPAFRLGLHAFIGVSAGFVVAVTIKQVIINKMVLPLLHGSNMEKLVLVFPLIMSLLLLTKTSSRYEWLGRPVVALLVGVGSATAVAGAVWGTLYPQIFSVYGLFDLRNGNIPWGAAGSLLMGVFVLLGTIFTLLYFQFTLLGKDKANGKPGRLMQFLTQPGQILITITLGAIFAGVLVAALTALVDRTQFVVLFLDGIFSKFLY